MGAYERNSGSSPRLSVFTIFSVTLLLLSAGQEGNAHLMVRSLESGSVLNPDSIIVGVASDLIVLVQCFPSENGTESIRWTYRNGTEVPVGLTAFGISQGEQGNDEGILRVYPAGELVGEGEFVCSDGNGSLLNVTFNTVDGLFFTSPVGLEELNSSSDEVTSLCSVPDIPDSNLSQGNESFCLVETDRGLFRSADIRITLPSFRTEPANFTAQSINGSSVAAFICSLTNPGNRSVSIRWFFLLTTSSDGREVELLPGGDNNVTIYDSNSDMPVFDTGSSILVLESVSEEDEGLYFCQAEFDGTDIFNSSRAELSFNSTAIEGGPIVILGPDERYDISMGDPLAIPCIASDLSLAIVTLGFSQEITPFIWGINYEAAGRFYTCLVEGSLGIFTQIIETVVVPLPSVSIHTGPERVVLEGTNLSLSCDPPENAVLVLNTTSLGAGSSSSLGAVSRDSTGFYQCLSTGGAAASADDSVVAVGTVYLLVTYLDTPTITSSTVIITTTLGVDSDLSLSCSVQGVPLPQLTWSIDPVVPLTSTQAPTLFKEPALSNLSINTSDLALGDYIITCSANIDIANSGDVIVPPTFITVNLSVGVVFENISVNVSATDVTLGNEPDTITVMCSVQASLEPVFNFTRNGVSVQVPAQLSMNQYQSVMTYNISDFQIGTEEITCTSTLSAGNSPPPLMANVSINVGVVFENISFSVSATDVTLGNEPDTITVMCSVQASLEPVFNFTRNGVSVQVPAQLSMNQYQSVMTYNISDFQIGTEEITCTSTLSVGNSPPPLMANVSINVGVVFENISIAIPDAGQVIVLRDNISDTIMINCTLQSGVTPNIEWRRNDTIINGTMPTLVGGNTYISMVTIDVSRLLPPSETFQCIGSLEGLENQFIVNTTAMVTVDAVLRNISIFPEEQVFNISLAEKVSGENGSVVMLTCQLESSLLPVVVWNQDGVVVNGTMPLRSEGEEFVVQSQLMVNRAELRGVVLFSCTASVEVLPSISAMATIRAYVFPEFTTEPLPLSVALFGDLITFSCVTVGIPVPMVTWEDTEGMVISDDRTFNISTTADEASYNTSSVLTFIASQDDNRTLNGSSFRCVAMNMISNRTESESGLLVIGGPPGQPLQFNVTNLTFNNASFVWLPPLSSFNITSYLLSINQTDSNSSTIFAPILDMELEPDLVSVLVFPPFNAASRYRARLVAVSRAGRSSVEAEVTFMTLEDIPGPPSNVRTSANTPGEILVMWEATPLGNRNGILTSYTVRYQNTIDDARQEVVGAEGAETFTVMLTGLEPGTTYTIQVAANTSAGMGPYSIALEQETIPMAPTSGPTTPERDTSRGVTLNSIPILLPDIDTSLFSHFWVIAMKLENNILSPNITFVDNSSFSFYTANIGVQIPYVVAEINDSSYNKPEAKDFTLGGNTSEFNDIPKYVNGPLSQNTFYTVFVWGFVPVPPVGTPRMKRLAGEVRQYSVFTSTPPLAPVATAGAGLSGGTVAGIVVAVIFLFAALVGVIVVSVILFGRFRYKSGDMSIQLSRKGSMRLKDQNEIVRHSSIRTSLRNSFRITSLRNQKAEEQLRDLNPDDARLPVPIDEFSDYVKSMHKNTDHLFSEEYEIITIKSPSLPHVQCSLPANVNKNRYANINCYDNSRVILTDNKDVNSTNYINANYIDGYQVKCAHVASQGPLANTTHDFWRMIWEQDSCCIVMLTNLVEKSRVKCHQYWPEVGGMTMGDISINLIEIQDLAYYTIRTFHVSKGSERREVKQFHYTGWPDFGVPDYPNPVIAFVKRISHYKRTTSGPDIVHCSAGVGRSGTFIAIQAMMEMIKNEESTDIFNFVLGMRQQRNYMVQTERQYIFIHDTILENLNIGNTEIKIQNLRRSYEKLQAQNSKTDSSLMEKEYRHLNELQEIDQSQFHPALSSVNQSKNRFPDILPYDRYRVRLLLHPGVSGSDYINASYVDGYQRRHQYILTQGPMINTATDFWRMIWEHRCSCIMMLCPLEEKGKEQSVCYWPVDKVRQHGDMFIEQTNISQFPAYVMREFAITNTKINESRIIKHYHYSDWLDSRSPTNAADVIDLIGVLHKTQLMCGGGPIVVHDSTSIGRSGTFVILSSILEQLKVEGVVDAFSMIHSLRQQQPGLVSNFEQYRFCYQAVMEFLDSFDHYANFD